MAETVEMEQAQLDVLHELVLRGLQQVDMASNREYGEAYDAFVEAAGYPLRIGDQPDRVRDVWLDIGVEARTVGVDDYRVKVRSGEPGLPRPCIECGHEIAGDVMIAQDEGPMHVECWIAWMQVQGDGDG